MGDRAVLHILPQPLQHLELKWRKPANSFGIIVHSFIGARLDVGGSVSPCARPARLSRA